MRGFRPARRWPDVCSETPRSSSERGMREAGGWTWPKILTMAGLVATGVVPGLACAVCLIGVAGINDPIAGGGHVPNIFSPASGHAKTLFDLAMFVLGVTGAIV